MTWLSVRAISSYCGDQSSIFYQHLYELLLVLQMASSENCYCAPEKFHPLVTVR